MVSAGFVDYDWSNAKQLWANAKPMDCQERLVTQASSTKRASPSTRVFVYPFPNKRDALHIWPSSEKQRRRSSYPLRIWWRALFSWRVF